MLVISFYPVVLACAEGQAQIFLDLLFSSAFLLWINRKDSASGFLIGANVLVKPQYVLLLVWSALRKNWKFVVAAAIPLFAGLSIGLLVFGWRNNIQYLDVIRFMGRHGETFVANQSFNGLFNRLVQKNWNTSFNMHGFADFIPAVYWLTLATSAIIVALAIFNRKPRTENGRIAEFGLVAIASTAASPIAWEHHYGILLPLFAWVLPRALESGIRSRTSILLLLSFVLCANDFRITNLVAHMPPLNLLQSLLFFGAGILFFHLRYETRQRGPEPQL